MPCTPFHWWGRAARPESPGQEGVGQATAPPSLCPSVSQMCCLRHYFLVWWETRRKQGRERGPILQSSAPGQHPQAPHRDILLNKCLSLSIISFGKKLSQQMHPHPAGSSLTSVSESLYLRNLFTLRNRHLVKQCRPESHSCYFLQDASGLKQFHTVQKWFLSLMVKESE